MLVRFLQPAALMHPFRRALSAEAFGEARQFGQAVWPVTKRLDLFEKIGEPWQVRGGGARC